MILRHYSARARDDSARQQQSAASAFFFFFFFFIDVDGGAILMFADAAVSYYALCHISLPCHDVAPARYRCFTLMLFSPCYAYAAMLPIAFIFRLSLDITALIRFM